MRNKADLDSSLLHSVSGMVTTPSVGNGYTNRTGWDATPRGAALPTHTIVIEPNNTLVLLGDDYCLMYDNFTRSNSAFSLNLIGISYSKPSVETPFT